MAPGAQDHPYSREAMSSESTVRELSRSATAARAALVAAATAALVGGIVLVIVLLRGHSAAHAPSAGARPARTPPSVLAPGFHGLALAGHVGDVLVGVGARTRGPVDVVVVPSDGIEARPADVRVRWRGRALSGSRAAPCGSACLRFPLRVLDGVTSELVVDVARPGKSRARIAVPVPARMPPSADALFREARSRMLGLRSLRMDETLGAGLSKPVVSTWYFEAPDRMSYSIAGGARAVVLGTRRWDDFGRGWVRSSSPRLQVPTFPWERARQTRFLGTTTLRGTRVHELAAWLPARSGDAPTWFVLSVAPDERVLRSRMLTTAHFMTDTYRDFGSVPRIRPPK